MSNRSRAASACPSTSPSPTGPRGVFRNEDAPPEIAIRGVIGEDVTSRDVIDQLDKLRDADRVILRINSDGGVVTEGMAIYAALRSHPAKFTAIVEGIAASIASVILCACDERRVAKGSFVMIHESSAGVNGCAGELEDMASTLRKINDQILDIYESRTGTKRARIARLIDGHDHYMTAEEAVELGFADAVISARAHFDSRAVARLNNLPEHIRAQTTEENRMDEKQAKALEEENARLKEELKKLKAKLEDEDEDEEQGKEPAHDESDDDEAKPEDEGDDEESNEDEEAKAVLALTRQLTGKRSLAEVSAALVARITTAGQSSDSRKIEVRDMIARGKLAPAMKNWALSCSARAWAAYRAEMRGKTVVPVGRSYREPETHDEPGDAPRSGSATPTGKLTDAERKFAKLLNKTDEEMIALRSVKPNYGPISKDR